MFPVVAKLSKLLEGRSALEVMNMPVPHFAHFGHLSSWSEPQVKQSVGKEYNGSKLQMR